MKVNGYATEDANFVGGLMYDFLPTSIESEVHYGVLEETKNVNFKWEIRKKKQFFFVPTVVNEKQSFQ